jgi:hypothetical protein
MNGDLRHYFPISGTEEINGVFYSWDFLSRREGRLNYSTNHDTLQQVDLEQTSGDFQRHIEEIAIARSNGSEGNNELREQVKQDIARERALEILETGNPRDFILDTFKTQHVGDIETAEGILIGTANQSISNSKGVQAAVFGESGRGKSHAARAMLHLFPVRYFMVASLSDKALFYLEADELRPGMTIFSDDARLSEGIEDIIKRSTAFFQEPTVNKVATKEGGKWTAKDLTIPPRINWLLTSVSSQGSEQLVNRQIAFGVDETPEQDAKVTKFELMKALDGRPEFDETDEVLTCREIILNIKENEAGESRLFKVKIPFADRIEWLDKMNRRNLPIFLDMVKGYAALNFKQRKKVDSFLIATEDDFKAAERLYNTRGGFQKLHINEREKEMLQHIAANDGELATSELMQKMKLSGVRVRQIAERLETVLPSFYIEKRSESAKDASDDGKSTITQRNYFCYTGAVTVDMFDSVVSLRERAEDDRFSHFKTTLTPPKPTKIKVVNETQEDQNKHLNQKEAYSNKVSRSSGSSERPLKAETEDCIDARIYSRENTLSDFEPKEKAEEGHISSLDGENSSEPKLKADFKRTLSGQFTAQNLLANDLLNALIQTKQDTAELLSYNSARSITYTNLQSKQRYKQLDGTYYKERFDFLAHTHKAIADALREVVREGEYR